MTTRRTPRRPLTVKTDASTIAKLTTAELLTLERQILRDLDRRSPPLSPLSPPQGCAPLPVLSAHDSDLLESVNSSVAVS
jgi:hypothetical protein